MLMFILRRLLSSIPTLILVSLFVFTLQKLLPGDPVLAMAGEERDPAVMEYLRDKYRLDDPIPLQYLNWVGNVLTGDLGTSLRTEQAVTTLLASKLPVTIELAVLALLIALLIGIPTGIISAVGERPPPWITGPTWWRCRGFPFRTSGWAFC
nr:ABC transporter permease [Pseudomonas syringae]